MEHELERLFRWIVSHLGDVFWFVLVLSGVLLPVFRRLAEARERKRRGERIPTADEAVEPEARAEDAESDTRGTEGPAEFDWSAWLERAEKRAAGAAVAEEPAEAERTSAPPPAPRPARSLEEEMETGEPVWSRRPLTEAEPLTEHPARMETEALTARRPAERVPLTEATPFSRETPLTELDAYEVEREPEAVGSLAPEQVETVSREVYEPEFGSGLSALDEPSRLSSIEREKPVSPAPAAPEPEWAVAGIVPTDAEGWFRGIVASEVLRRPVALQDEPDGPGRF